jgi:predicted lipid-binding transport protein (Tim44 family)
MKKTLLALALIAPLAACTQTERGAGIGAASGAVIGGVATGNVRGAAIGAGIGGLAGALIGNSQERAGYCVYRDQYNPRRTYEARCR